MLAVLEDEQTNTAAHEAGHAVVAHYLGVAVDLVTIASDATADGGVALGSDALPAGFDGSTGYGAGDTQSRDRLEALILIKVAGGAAVELSGSDPVGCDTDDDHAWALARTVTYTHDEAAAFLTWLRLRALALLAMPANRLAHAALVAALLERPTMT